MAKMRVHELAKELNIKSQEIIDALSTTEYAVKSASSGLEDDAQKVVRSKFTKKDAAPKAAPKAEEKAAPAPKAEEKKSTRSVESRPEMVMKPAADWMTTPRVLAAFMLESRVPEEVSQ